MKMNHLPNALNLPPIDQIGFVVRDLNVWVERYEPLFGPFSFMDGSVSAAQYRGRIEDADLNLAFGHSGNLEIEFIEWRGGHSPHREFIESGFEGVHHVRFRVDNCEEWISKMRPHGYEPIWSKIFSPELAFVYLERNNDPVLIEFLQMPC